MPLPEANYACTLQIARNVWTQFNCHALTFLAEQFGIVYDAHNALDDARTCGKLFSMASEKLNCTNEELFFQKEKLLKKKEKKFYLNLKLEKYLKELFQEFHHTDFSLLSEVLLNDLFTFLKLLTDTLTILINLERSEIR